MRHAVFVVPFKFETSMRFLRAALSLPDVAISLISQDSLESFGPEIQRQLAGHHRVDDALSAADLVLATRSLAKRVGPVSRLIGVLEQLQEPLADARAELGLPGVSREASHNFRDKARMKDVLREAGVPCARHALAHNLDEARAFARSVGGPMVVKPPAGAGAVNTFRVDSVHELEETLRRFHLSPSTPALIEEFVVGEEHSFDSVMLDGRMIWHNISRYRPTPLEVLQNDWIQWCVLLPRRIEGPEYDGIRLAGEAAVRALGLRDGLSHMEWFRRKDGSVAISEVGARPPGAQFTSLISYAHDRDFYRAWTELVILDRFDPPERKYSVGAAYFRGQGKGRVKAVHGLDRAQQELGELVVESRLPRAGQAPAATYEGDGYAILRHPRTEVVADGLQRLVQMVRVELG